MRESTQALDVCIGDVLLDGDGDAFVVDYIDALNWKDNGIEFVGHGYSEKYSDVRCDVWVRADKVVSGEPIGVTRRRDV